MTGFWRVTFSRETTMMASRCLVAASSAEDAERFAREAARGKDAARPASVVAVADEGARGVLVWWEEPEP